jgi:hypothetical protein
MTHMAGLPISGRLTRVAAVYATLCAACFGADARSDDAAAVSPPSTAVNGPILGYLTSERGLHPILGIPGSASISPALNLGLPDVAALAPERAYALVRQNHALHVLTWEAAAALHPVGVAVTREDEIALSPAGTAAAVHDRSRALIRIVQGLPGNPSVQREISTGPVAGKLRFLAVSDDGEALLAAFERSDSGPELAALTNAGLNSIPLPQKAAAAAFRPGTHQAVVADQLNDAIYLLPDGTQPNAAILISSQRDGISGPVAVAYSRDGKFAVAANSASSSVAVINPAGGVRAIVPCACVPSRLERFNGNAVFRLNGDTDGTIWVFDGNATRQRVVFVPPLLRPNDGRSSRTPTAGGRAR